MIKNKIRRVTGGELMTAPRARADGSESDAAPASRFFFFKQKTAYGVTEGDWSSDVCSSDLARVRVAVAERENAILVPQRAVQELRSEERRVGKECAQCCRFGWARHHKKK